MGKALYRKYRSRSLDDVVGQEHITSTLKNAISSGRLSHAYLFTGPRGTGKTSIARILAHLINDLPYDSDALHLDIIEIDAASNRRIDEIRDLRDKVHIAPSSTKYKVYIIDEVHMLTREAFNALLKTLEEPPAHAVFILATTELHKVPATIVSRTQRFSFKPVSKNNVIEHLRTIASKEKITIDDEALELLADYGEGSFRDSISLLDQLRGHASVNSATVRDVVGTPSQELIMALSEAIEAQQPQKVLELLDTLRDQGITAASSASALSTLYRKHMRQNDQVSGHRISLLKDLLTVAGNSHPQEMLEIILLQASHQSSDGITDAKKLLTQPTSEQQQQKPTKVRSIATPPSVPRKSVADSNGKPAIVPGDKAAPMTIEKWPNVLEMVQTETPSLYRALRIAEPEIINNELHLYFEFPLHQKKVDETRNKTHLTTTLAGMGLQINAIHCHADKNRFTNKVTSPKETNQEPNLPASAIDTPDLALTNISNIFGTPELLES